MSPRKPKPPQRKGPTHGPDSKGSPDEPKGHSPFPIVGIGASAGGLEALTQLFTELPADTGMAFLVVQHLDPRLESRLPELLSRTTRMEVLEAEQGQSIHPNHVYVITPNTRLALAKGVLHLSARGEGRASYLPIDHLFRSLAEDQQGRAIAVVLSGSGSDGTQGLCEIKAVGGITFAQEEASAVHTGMPHSAIESGCADFVLAPDEIARRLAKIGDHPYLATDSIEPDLEPSSEVHKILAVVRAETGVDFSLYRDTTIKRRIMRRMALHTQRSLAGYAQRLKNDRKEIQGLYQDLVISVTSFFRNPEVFEALKVKAFSELAKGRPPNAPFRVWVPGCSTGQEAYSMAMALLEFFDERPARPPIQIFATDLVDQPQLDRARAGVYPEGIVGEVSPERLRRFFRHEDHFYRIEKSVRDLVIFAQHNVTSDPPFSHLDLISCRNVLIYMTAPLQKRVLPAFHYALNPNGFLVLGSAESVGRHTDLFEPKDTAHRIYSKKAARTRHPMMFPARDYKPGAAHLSRLPAAGVLQDTEKEADRILLGRYAPPGVLVDEGFSILQIRGRVSNYLELPPGEPTVDLLKMAREGLFLDLRNALAEARKQETAVRRTGIRLRSSEGSRRISLEVIPVRPQSGSKSYLVLFHDPPPAAPHMEAPLGTDAADDARVTAAREIAQLRQEIASTREYLQSMIEQQDASNEELRSANEEILSSNEELQSTNEELETSKEELQSTNEELTTVNEQLQHRTTEVDQLNNDLINLLASTNLPMVMVGVDCRIRRFTPAAKKLMSLIGNDVGRPIDDIRMNITVPDLPPLIGGVIEHVRTIEQEVRDREGRYYILRVHPYRTTDNEIDGAVLVLVDVDQMRRDQENLRRQAALLELSQDAISIRDAANVVIFWNRGAAEMYGFTADEAMGKRLDRLLGTDARIWEELNEELDRAGSWEGQISHTRKDGKSVLYHCREVLVHDRTGARLAVLGIYRAVSK